jgi:hypothetical protein
MTGILDCPGREGLSWVVEKFVLHVWLANVFVFRIAHIVGDK